MTGSGWRRAAIGMALGATVALSACGEEEVVEAPVEGVVEGIEVTNARLVLPPVSGNPAAVYFDVVYNGERGVSISGAEVAGAENTTVHATVDIGGTMEMVESGPFPLRSGEPGTFEPGGYHIMAMGLEGLEPGGTAEVTLRISGGQTHKFDAEVRAAGEER